MSVFSTNLCHTPDVEVHNPAQPFGTPSNQSSTDHDQSSCHPPTSRSLTLFPNAQNFEVKDSQFNAIEKANFTIHNNETNYTTVHHNTNNGDSVATILWPHVAAGAIFDSAARHAAGKCHPGTREKIIQRILDWIENYDTTKRILWLYGSAGAGKSAVEHTICERLKESHPKDYGASFFFSGGSPDRGNALRLFTTLAYQLAIHFPSIRKEINHVLSVDPSLPTKSMEIQFQCLIIQPLQRCQDRTPLSHCPVLIIDGLDECADDEGMDTQRSIVALIAKSIVDHNLPLRCMIASRPEYWIREAFEAAPVASVTTPLSLRDDDDADKDIEVYLINEFEKIRLKNERIMRSVVLPWPPTDVIEQFVWEASGQYLYAKTVLKFVEGNYSKHNNPQKQLQILTSPGPHRATAYSELDRLYGTIVSACPEQETMKRVLAALLLEAHTTVINTVLRVNPDELVLVLDAMGSLIEKRQRKPLSGEELEDQELLESIFGSLEDQGAMSFCHLSFCEFLRDETRSGPFYIDLRSDAVPNDIVNTFFEMIHQNLDQNYETEPHIFLDIDFVTYHGTMTSWATCLSIWFCSLHTLLSQVTSLTAKLNLYDFSRFTRMHSVFYFMREVDCISRGLCGLFDDEQINCHEDDENPEKLMEFQTACQQFRLAVDRAHNEALSVLASCTDFEAIPTLVYLTEYQSERLLPVEGLSTTAGVTDVISTLRRHRYIVPMWYTPGSESWRHSPVAQKFIFWNNDSGPSWRTQGAWRDLRLSFACQTLKSIFTVTYKRIHFWTRHREIEILQGLFNEPRGILDIDDKEYFHNTFNLAILEATTDLEAWIELLDKSWRDPSSLLLASIMCWINRHLTNQATMTLLQEYDYTLQEKMTKVLKHILEYCFLPKLTRSHSKELWAYGLDKSGKNSKATSIKVQPLPHGFDEEETPDSYLAYESWDDSWHRFHNALFGERGERSKPIIHPSHWHPYLVSRLLKLLVRFLYGRIHSEFAQEYHRYDESFPYISSCLPYAHPTPENLDALRAVVYLFPKVTPAWNPPERLWSSLVEFLMRYDRSILSSEELDLFVMWLNSTQHADITTYIHDTPSAILTPENMATSGPTSHTGDPSASIPFDDPTQPIPSSSVTTLDQPRSLDGDTPRPET